MPPAALCQFVVVAPCSQFGLVQSQSMFAVPSAQVRTTGFVVEATTVRLRTELVMEP
jgi:hypothetical protein